MSYNSQHLAHPITGIRGSVEIIEDICNTLKDTTWENFKEKHISVHEYGNTRFNDLSIVAYYFKNKFVLRHTGLDLGYSSTGGTPNTAPAFRLKRVNTKSFLDIGRALIKVGLITVEDISTILSGPLYGGKWGRGSAPWAGRVYKYYAKRIVNEAITKWGGRRKAAKKLKVNLKVITYWAKL